MRIWQRQSVFGARWLAMSCCGCFEYDPKDTFKIWIIS
jgi:hypothetical protein